MKIGLRFFARNSFCLPADAHLPVQFNPIKRQRRVRVGIELLSFFALVVGEKDEAVLVEAFQQNNAYLRPAVTSSRGQAHCIDVANTGINSRGEPVSKLLDRIAIEIASAQTFSCVLVTRSGGIARCFHHDKNSAAQYCAARKLSNGSQGRGYRRRRTALPQFLDDFWNDFNRAVDLRFSVKPAKRKTQTPPGIIAGRIHGAQYV